MPQSCVWIYCWIQLQCIIIKSIKVKFIDGACLVNMQLLTLNINILMAWLLTITKEQREINSVFWHKNLFSDINKDFRSTVLYLGLVLPDYNYRQKYKPLECYIFFFSYFCYWCYPNNRHQEYAIIYTTVKLLFDIYGFKSTWSNVICLSNVPHKTDMFDVVVRRSDSVWTLTFWFKVIKLCSINCIYSYC